MPNLPYETPKECEDAKMFVSRMAEVDAKVAQTLNQTHEKCTRSENEKRPEAEVLSSRQQLW